jgi:hypothetical protein
VAAPEYVPQPPIAEVRSYTSPPWRPESWRAVRPGDFAAGFDRGEGMGSPGPDQGYVHLLARRFRGQLQLAADENEDDAIVGCTGVALKRASIFGRAPMLADLTVAFTVWGFLGDAPPDMIGYRQKLFAGAADPYHYERQRHIVDLVPEDVLRMTPEQVAESHRRDWRSLVTVP